LINAAPFGMFSPESAKVAQRRQKNRRSHARKEQNAAEPVQTEKKTTDVEGGTEGRSAEATAKGRQVKRCCAEAEGMQQKEKRQQPVKEWMKA